MNERGIRALSRLLYVGCLLALFLVGLKAVDYWLDIRAYPTIALERAGPTDLHPPHLLLNSFSTYPFTGGHTLANACINGGRLCTGDHGFRISFDLDKPPTKPAGAARVIIIGGSGAWGFGANYAANTIDQVAEREANNLMPCGRFKSVEVINLAMNGSATQQNAIALNLWGHQLEPDLVVSLSGNNDLMVPLNQHYLGFETVWALTQQAHSGNARGWLASVGELFPGIMNKTTIGLALRILSMPSVESQYKHTFLSRFGQTSSARKAALREISIPAYVHALKTIKRDFSGLPILVTFQPYLFRPDKRGPLGMTNEEMVTFLENYAVFRVEARKQLDEYMNDGWRFFDSHEFMEQTWLSTFDPAVGSRDGIHMVDAEQVHLGRELARRVVNQLCSL